MALTPKLTHGVPTHKGGEQYEIPVTLELMDGEVAVYTKNILVNHNESRTIAESLGQDYVKNELQDAINTYFKYQSVKDQTAEITNALGTLQNKLEIPK